MKTGALRLGIVGCGRIARAYAEAIADCAEVRVTSACDAEPSAAAALAASCGAASCANYDDVAQVDAVLVCTPPAAHLEAALHFAERGIPVLCEKPFTLDIVSAIDLVRASRRRGVCIAMASKFRYVADVVEARQIVGSGEIGEPLLFENAFTSYVDMAGRWNADARISGGGVLVDNGSHAFDLARWFVGPLSQITVVEAPRVQGLSVEETVHVAARARRGSLCRIDLSWSLERGSESYLRISGAQGTVVVGWRGSRWRRRGGNWISFGTGYDKSAALRQQLVHFGRAVRGQAATLVTPLEAVASVAAVEAGYESLAMQRWTSIRDFDNAAAADAEWPLREEAR